MSEPYKQIVLKYYGDEMEMTDWVRSEAALLGVRGTDHVKNIIRLYRQGGGVDRVGDAGSEIDELTRQQVTERKEKLLDTTVMGWLDDPEVMKTIPASSKAAIINQRLPRVQPIDEGVDKDVMRLRSMLEGMPTYDGLRGDLAVCRLRMDKAEGEAGLLREELEILQRRVEKLHGGAEASGRRDDAYRIYRMFCGWRSVIVDALRGEAAADKARLLRGGGR